ncbi:MAG: PDZ domain-containing protein [Acidobacteriota bacterium]
MSHASQPPGRAGWWIASSVAVAIAALSLIDLPNNAFSGFIASGGTQVTQVTPESPAAVAGFQVGDRILVSAGVDTTDLRRLIRQPRAAIGETRHYLVERQGESAPVELAVTFSELPRNLIGLTYGAALIGLAFLVCGVGTYFRFPAATSRLLAYLGVAGLIAFVAPPYIAQADLRLISALVALATTLLMPALLLHFFLRFPLRRPFLDRKIARGLLYGPVAIATVVAGVALLVQPKLVQLATAVASAVAVVQLLIAIGVLIRSFVKAHPEERAASGLNVLLFSFLGGVLPLVVAGFVPSLPGASNYFLTSLLIPIALAYAVSQAADGRPVERRTVPAHSGVNAGANPWIDVDGSS